MKLPDFDPAEMAWDSWRAFHIDHEWNTFVQFDTGEFVVCARSWSPDKRKTYDKLHLRIVATSDDDCPRLYIPGAETPIPKSHLNHKGQQVLLLDLDHKRAVSVDLYLTKANAPLVPERFTEHGSRRVAAWYAGAHSMPVGAPITRHCLQPLTHDERAHINELTDAAKVWLQMQPDHEMLEWKNRRDASVLPVRDFVDVSFSVLTTDHRKTVAMKGFDMIIKEEHPWLTFGIETTTEKAND